MPDLKKEQHLKPGGWKVLLSAALSILFLAAACFLSGNLPYTSGEVELLFPSRSESLDWAKLRRKTFENVYTDTIVLSKSDGEFNESDTFLLEELQEELLGLSGIENLIIPQDKVTNDLFGLFSKSKKISD